MNGVKKRRRVSDSCGFPFTPERASLTGGRIPSVPGYCRSLHFKVTKTGKRKIVFFGVLLPSQSPAKKEEGVCVVFEAII
jgi:hypothetical protein